MPGQSYEVGSIVAYLRMDDSPWNRTIAEAEARAKELNRVSPTIKIDVDTAKGLTQLAALRAALNSVGDAQLRVTQAQAQLDAARKTGDTDKIQAAEQRLAKVMRDVDQAGLKLAATEHRIAEANDAATAATAKHDAATQALAKSTRDAAEVGDRLATTQRDIAAGHDLAARAARGQTSDLAQLSNLSAALSSVTDAQNRAAVAQARLDLARRSGSATKVQVAEQVLAKALRDVDQAGLKLLVTQQRLNDANEKAGQSTQKLGANVGLLVTALLAVGPATIPIAGVAAGALFGLAAAGGAALLAVLGIRDAMKQGTSVGQSYKAAFAPVTTEFKQLKEIGAENIFSGINRGVQESKALFPELNKQVGQYTTQLGYIVGNTGPALLGFLSQMSPLFTEVGNQLVLGSQGFENWATSGDKAGKFVAYVQGQLPAVISFIGQTATAVEHLVIGLGAMGGGTLSGLTMMLRLVNSIPIGVLQIAAPAVLSLVFALKGLNAISSFPGIRNLNLGLAGGLGLIGVVTAGIYALSQVLNQNAADQAHIAQATQTYTQALQANSGAIGDNVRAQELQNLAQAGVLDLARKAGLSMQDLTAIIEGQAPSWDTLVTKTGSLGVAGIKLANELQAQNKAFHAGKAESDALSESLSKTLGGVIGFGNAVNQNVVKLGTTVGAYGAATKAADDQATATANATLQMRIQGDTAGLLKVALDTLAGKTLSLGEAQTHYAQTVTAATDAIRQNGTAVDLNTAKGQSNRSAIEQMAEANRTLITAQLQGITSSTRANAIIDQANQTFATNAAKIYGAGTAAYDYALKVGAIPHVAVTQVSLDDAAALKRLADYNAKIRATPGYWETQLRLNIQEVVNKQAAGSAGTGLSQRASGGQLNEGYTLINEKGPELLYKRGNSVEVVTAGRTKALENGLSGGFGGNGAQVTQNIYPAPGMSETALATKVGTKLDQLLRSR